MTRRSRGRMQTRSLTAYSWTASSGTSDGHIEIPHRWRDERGRDDSTQCLSPLQAAIESSPLFWVEAAPDAVLLAVQERCGQAPSPNRTRGTDRTGSSCRRCPRVHEPRSALVAGTPPAKTPPDAIELPDGGCRCSHVRHRDAERSERDPVCVDDVVAHAASPFLSSCRFCVSPSTPDPPSDVERVRTSSSVR